MSMMTIPPLRRLPTRTFAGASVLAVIVALACAGGARTARGAGEMDLSAMAPAAPAERVAWDERGDFASLLARAKKQKKLVFVDFYATWCGPCKMMDRQTYTDSTVGAAARHFLTRKIDAEKGEGRALSTRYKVTAYPTLLIVDGDGKERNRGVGFQPPDRFSHFLDDTRTGRGTVEGIQAMIAKGEDTAPNRIALAQKLAERGDLAGAGQQLARGLALDPKDQSGRAADAVLAIASRASATGMLDSSAANVDRWLASVPPDHPRMDAILTQQANVMASQGKNAEALDVLRRVLVLKPDDALFLESFARFCARTNQALDDALAQAKHAVEVTNSDASALDVLAEVHGALGNWDLAVETAEKAVNQRPGDGYLRGQLERYQEKAVEAAQAKRR